MRFLVITILLAFASGTFAGNIRRCSKGGGSATYNPDDIQITGCTKKSNFCIFVKGKSAKMTLPFIPKSQLTKVNAVVKGIIAGIPVPFPLPDANACNEALSPGCPLSAGQNVTYTESLPVRKQYPSLTLKVRWELRDQSENDIICIEFKVKIKN